jgi:hypothetical protein
MRLVRIGTLSLLQVADVRGVRALGQQEIKILSALSKGITNRLCPVAAQVTFDMKSRDMCKRNLLRINMAVPTAIREA